MKVKSYLIFTSTALFWAGAQAQVEEPDDPTSGDEPTIRAIPDPYEDLPEAVTKEILLPAEADDEAVAASEAGRLGQRRDDGLERAREAAAQGLEIAAGHREALGRSNAPDGLPDAAMNPAGQPDELPQEGLEVPAGPAMPDTPETPAGPPGGAE